MPENQRLEPLKLNLTQQITPFNSTKDANVNLQLQQQQLLPTTNRIEAVEEFKVVDK